jgi:hypothetical protein
VLRVLWIWLWVLRVLCVLCVVSVVCVSVCLYCDVTNMNCFYLHYCVDDCVDVFTCTVLMVVFMCSCVGN